MARGVYQRKVKTAKELEEQAIKRAVAKSKSNSKERTKSAVVPPVERQTRVTIAETIRLKSEERMDDPVVVEPASQTPGTPPTPGAPVAPAADTYHCQKCHQDVVRGAPKCRCGADLNWQGIA